MSEKKNKWEVDDDSQYVGNYFGWDVSLMGLGVIIFMLLILTIRWFSLPPEKRTLEMGPQTEQTDSTSTTQHQ